MVQNIRVYMDRTLNGFSADLVDADTKEFLGGTQESKDRSVVEAEARSMAEAWHPDALVSVVDGL